MLSGNELEILYPYDKPVALRAPELADIAGNAASMYTDSLWKQLTTMEVQPDDHLRASLVGKAAVDVLGRKFFSEYYGNITHPRFWQLFHDGDVWEADYYFWLASRGVEFVSTQGETEYWGVPGHYDFVVNLNGKRVLLELKTANKGYFTSLLKQQVIEDVRETYGFYRPYFANKMTDFRGHITQISLYRESLGVDDAVLVVKCKDTSDLLLYPVPHSTDLLQRVQSLVNAWHTSQTWLDIFSYVGIPEPRKELKNRMHTGRHLVPPKLYGSPIIPLIYEWVTEAGKVIIAGYRLPEGVTIPEQLFEEYSKLDIYTYDPDHVYDLLDEWKEFNSYDDED